MLGKLFKRKKELKPSNDLKVAIVDEASDDLYLNFGIIDERRDELIELTLTAFKNHSRLHNSYVEIVSKCKHVNEIIVCTIIFERKLVHQKESPLALLEKLFGEK